MAEMEARISAALKQGPWLLGERFSAADILIQSPWRWFQDLEPGDPAIRDWMARGAERAAFRKVMAEERI
jgi:glutathione S-transferase